MATSSRQPQPYHHHHQQQQQFPQQHPGQQHQGQAEIRFVPVSVSKTARAYFNICRKALETHRRVELSALEAAVVIAVDASFLLTRAKMGTIERVNSAFVQVPSHRPAQGYSHLRKARIQIVLRRTREFDWAASGDLTTRLISCTHKHTHSGIRGLPARQSAPAPVGDGAVVLPDGLKQPAK